MGGLIVGAATGHLKNLIKLLFRVLEWQHGPVTYVCQEIDALLTTTSHAAKNYLVGNLKKVQMSPQILPRSGN